MKQILALIATCCMLGMAWAEPAPVEKFHAVDLQSKANQKLTDNFGSGAEGNNLKELPTGTQTIGGIKFTVRDGLIQLGSKILPKMPAKIDGIKVDKAVARLHILHATCWWENDGTPIGEYKVTFADKSSVTIPIAYGKDVRDWWYFDSEKGGTPAKVVWVGDNERAKVSGKRIHLYLTTWENPKPGTAIASIDYASTMTECAPFCVAITASELLKARVMPGPVTLSDIEQLWTQLAGDGHQASDAVEILAGVPKQTIPFLSAHLRAVKATAVEKQINTLITQLASDQFLLREKAAKELEKQGPEALVRLRRSLEKPTSLEARRRMERLVEKLKTVNLTADQRRLHAALLVLEVTATAEGRRVLEEVSRGSAGVWLGAEAQLLLQRSATRKD